MKVKDLHPRKSNVKGFVRDLRDAGGFVAKKVAVGLDILERMFADQGCVRLLSFPGCIIATGTRGVLVDFVREKRFNALITTCGTLDHDFARVWADYRHGTFQADDRELHKRGIYRLGNIFIPKECYGGIIEDKVQPILENLYKSGVREISGYELIWELGRALARLKRGQRSILYWAWRNKIPIFVPGLTDGAIGSQLWLFSQKRPDFKINLIKDEQALANIVWDAKRLGALMIGGGISKHHTIWWAQFGRGLDYAVYITTAVEWDGSLSGARTREAISWGKIKEAAKHITIEGDATILLPLLAYALKENGKSKMS